MELEEDAIKNDLILPVSYDDKNGIRKVIRKNKFSLSR